ncbi:MAG: sirohydrochlorin chelatase [Burkholderiales bacterium]
MSEGIVLFAHGSRDREWAAPFERLAATLAKKVPGPVALAYLESMQPSIGAAIASLIAEGARTIRVVPVFFGAGGHVKEDLPRLVAQARATHGSVSIHLESPVGDQDAVIEAIAAAIARA